MNRWIDKEVVRFLDRVGKRIAKGTGMGYKSIKPMHPRDSMYEDCAGSCEFITGDIRINTTLVGRRKFYTIEYLIDTLIHEMAHYGQDDTEGEHGRDWQERYGRLKAWVKTHLYKA